MIGSGEGKSAFHTLGQGERMAHRTQDMTTGVEASMSNANSGTDSAMLSVAESIEKVAKAPQEHMEKSAAMSSRRETGSKKVKALKPQGKRTGEADS